MFGVVKIDHQELRLNGLAILLSVVTTVQSQVIVSYRGEVRELIVIDVHSEALLYLLLDKVIDHRIGLTRPGCPQHHCSSKRIDDIDPTLVPLLLIVKASWQIDAILICHQSRLLHKAFILDIKRIVQESVTDQA